MQAALLIYTTSFVLGSIVMLFYRFKVKSEAIEYFLAFYVMSTIGSLLIFFRVEINNQFISIIIANLFLIIGNLLLVYGIARLLKSKTNFLFVSLVLMVFCTSFLYFTYIDFNVIARVISYNGLVILILTRSLHHLYLYHKDEDSFFELLTPTVSLVFLFTVFRIVSIFIFNESSNNFLSFQRDSLNVALVGISYILILVGLFSLLTNNATKSLKESERSKSSLISNLPGFVYRCLNDEHWTMEFLSNGFETMSGYLQEQVLGNKELSFEELICEEFRDSVRSGWDSAIAKKERFIMEYKIRRQDGKEIWVWEQGIGIYDKDDNCVEIEGFIADVDSRKTLEENLEFLSYKDSLTSLYNRRYIEEQMTRLEISRTLPISIIVSDINGLKFINDSFGHLHGDEVIKSTAEVFKRTLRGYELISRLGGDEFLIILENTSHEDCEKVINRIQKECQKEQYASIGLSIALGYATKTSKDQSLVNTRKQAEDNMYQQKIYSKPSTRRKAVDAVVKTLYEKDELSEQHSRSVAAYCKLLAKEMNLSDAKIRQVETAALLHDVGKIIISDRILKSTGKLSEDEYNQIKKHPEIGQRILNSVPELSKIATIILAHHERIDGKGYPNGLKNDDIPLLSRIITICDAYDAMVNVRLYKERFTKDQAIEELNKNKGTQFDAVLVDKFLKVLKSEDI